MEKEGFTNTKEIGIKHRKDRKLKSESINKHLMALFDLSKFSESGYELIRSLALLGYIRIAKDKFLEYCPTVNCVDELEARRIWTTGRRHSRRSFHLDPQSLKSLAVALPLQGDNLGGSYGFLQDS